MPRGVAVASIARLPSSTDDPRASGSTADRHQVEVFTPRVCQAQQEPKLEEIVLLSELRGGEENASLFPLLYNPTFLHYQGLYRSDGLPRS